MKPGLSIKNKLRKDWKRYYFSEKLKRVFNELSLWDRIKFVISGHIY